ncbi:hypothetical protein [Cellulomonas aerilata]|nr:hypothetical protein [Cellulomonas aerilata]
MAARHDDTGDAPDRPDRDDIAERWAEIIADLGPLDADESVDTAAPDGPPDTGASPDPGAGPAVTYPVAPWVSARPGQSAPRELSGRDWSGTDDIEAAEAELDDREHFVPPEPGPVLGGDPLLTMAWFGAAGVPIALLVALIVWRDAPVVLMQAAGVVFLLSCGLLLWRMPHHRDDDHSGPGAVV